MYSNILIKSTVDPTVTNDIAHGCLAGIFWLNTTTGVRFQCDSEAVGAAVWTPVQSLFIMYAYDSDHEVEASELGAQTFYAVNVSARNVTFDLPAPSDCTGKVIHFKIIKSGYNFVISPGSAKVDGSTSDSVISTLWTIVSIVSDGTEFYKL